MPFHPLQGNHNTLITIEGYSLGSTTGVYFVNDSVRTLGKIIDKNTRQILVYPPKGFLSGEMYLDIWTEYGNARTKDVFRFIPPPRIDSVTIQENTLVLKGYFEYANIYSQGVLLTPASQSENHLEIFIADCVQTNDLKIQNGGGEIALNTELAKHELLILGAIPNINLNFAPKQILGVKPNMVYYIVPNEELKIEPTNQIITKNNRSILARKNELIIAIGLPNNVITLNT